MRRTVKVPVDFPKDKIFPLMKTCAQVYNIHVEWSFNCHSYNKNKAHHELYSSVKSQFPNLPTGLIQSIRDMSLESIKALKFKFKPFKSDISGIRFDKRCCSLRGNLLSISTLDKRERTLIKIPKYFQEVFTSWKFTGLQLVFDRKKNQFFACLNYEKTSPSFQEGDVLGIDRGLKNIVYCSNGYSVSGKNRNRIKRKYVYRRSKLKAKGTRSAKRRLVSLRNREKRFSQNENHVISKELIQLPYQTFVLEKLKQIGGKKKGKRFNRRISNWSYYQLEIMLSYKAEALGKGVEFVDARYTSQKCNNCGYIERSNRKQEAFECKKCGHKDHADHNASKNIRDLYITGKIPKGQAEVNQPIVLPTFALANVGIEQAQGLDP